MQITGENIVVKLAEESDAQSLLALEVKNRDFFQQFTERRDDTFYTYEGQLGRIQSALRMQQEDRGYLFFIFLRSTGQLIGEVILSEVVRYNLQSCWIGYFLDKDFNGKGYMTEAVQLVVSYAFTELELHRIEAGVMPHNTGSMKVLLKAGFTKEGIARKNVNINGHWEDHQTLAIIKDDWAGKAATKKVQRKNPSSIAPPIGSYTHLTTVPNGAGLLVLSGQVGNDKNGEIPVELNQQLYNALQNIKHILAEESVSVDQIIKINIWATEEMDWHYFHQVWQEFHGGTPPAMTMAYVPALAVSSLKVEIEAWAAKW